MSSNVLWDSLVDTLDHPVLGRKSRAAASYRE